MIFAVVELLTWPAILIVLAPALLFVALLGNRKDKGKGKKR